MKIGEGNTAEIFLAGEQRVVKLFRSGLPVELADKEWHAAKLITALNLPAPKAWSRDEQNGRQAIIYDLINGTSSLHALLKAPWRMREYSHLVARLHAGIHEKAGDDFPPQKVVLEHTIKGTPLSDEQKKIIIERLHALPDGDALCHGDMHPDNIMLTQDGPIILDWMTAYRGNPAGDVARTALLLTVGVPPTSTPLAVRVVLQLIRRRFCQQYLHMYFSLTGLTREQVSAWELPVAAARLSERLHESEKELLLGIIAKHLKQ